MLIALTNAPSSKAGAIAAPRSEAHDETAYATSEAGDCSAASTMDVSSEGRRFAPPAPAGVRAGSRFSFGINAGFILPENDLRLTTGGFPSYSAGLFGQIQFRGRHRLRAVGEVWNFSSGLQSSQNPSWVQTINTQDRAIAIGGQYLYRLGGRLERFSLGGGAYLARWSVDSVNRVTIGGDTVEGSGNSYWYRPGEGAIATYRVSRRLSLESRWIWSTYGYEYVHVSAGVFGAGWSF